MRRTLVLMLTLAMVIAFATPAAAKKGGGGQATHDYDVTISGALATICPGGWVDEATTPTGLHSITMTGSLNSVLRADDANLEATGSPGLADGCHGLSYSAFDGGQFGGALWLAFSGDTVELSWRFDYTWDSSTQGKRTVWTATRIYELTSEPMQFIPDEAGSAVVEGLVTLRRFDRDGKTGAWTSIGTAAVTFTLQIVPAS